MSAQIDVNTLLITILLAICGWNLRTTLKHVETLARLSTIVGLDNGNGHKAKLDSLDAAFDEIKETLSDMRERLRVVEMRVGVRRGHSHSADADSEED